MNDITTMICDWCGKEFPADARACVEAGVHAYHPPTEGEEWKSVDFDERKPEEFSDDEIETFKETFGLNDLQVEELLRTGNVEDLGGIVCVECQDAALDESLD